MDPRPAAAALQLSTVERIICVGSGKGGVGKSVISAVGALLLAKKGRKVGILDLDIHGPSAHTILGLSSFRIKEERGILPWKIAGVSLMSAVPFIRRKPALLRGQEITDAVLELLAVTRWGKLNFLIVDLPPGTGEEVMDVVRVVKHPEFVLVSTPSRIVTGTVGRLGLALRSLNVEILGVIENMRLSSFPWTKNLAERLKTRFLGSIKFDQRLEAAIGKPGELLKTAFAQDLRKILEKIT